ncbi:MULTISPECIES: ATP-grasp fold amidoligase family protein [Vibrio harveyi group]|uniref:ATP-grasp fold amidoligase family protein n=1 Tax=Vibrio harveyi group TaxID=717610 RepID=UPI00215CF6E7|nr:MULTISPECIES: ATP-grasp fold amidoligase family protein [Vibrio harveyi group]EGQ8193615.1 glycosyl transferase [Vibrio parahaemolyticus]ELB2766811.1 hypothetical protein [Vibrio alginolyticus]MCR9440182.1 hypothetical protein [Vibrio alginolyticus]MCS0105933.1 hypothetical protein [Vibrio alginolyticus]MCS0305985.1 hypothetical protein [Vibrio diabolicus]
MIKTVKSLLFENISDYNYDRVRYLKSDIIYKFRKANYSNQRLINDFFSRFGFQPNLNNPSTFNEKLLLKRINRIGDNLSFYADKYAVREYVSDTIGEKYLIPLIDTIGKGEKFESNKYTVPVIAKASHASSLNQIIKEPGKFDEKRANFLFKKWLERDYQYYWGEWYYSEIEPRIVVEKLLLDDKGTVPNDYKFHVFYDEEGRTEIFIQVDVARFTEHKRNFYDVNWNQLDIELEYEKSSTYIDKPFNLDEMLKLVKILSKPFQYSRIDLYDFDGFIYFGEITFIPEAGRGRFNSVEVDKEWGKLLRITS